VEVKLEVTLEEAVAIVNLLGTLPTKVGAWPLVIKIKAQAEPQVPQIPQEEKPE
jgi:hypothetical protein